MVLKAIKYIALYTTWCCVWFSAGALQAQTGPQGLRLYQIENADTANTGDSRASYENYFVVTKLDTFGIDDYRLYYEDTLFTVLYGGGDSIRVLNVGDTMYIEYPEPGGGGGDSSYVWRLQTNGATFDTIVNGETVNLVAGTNITLTQSATDVTIDADSCLQNLEFSGDTIFLTDCAGNRLDTAVFNIEIEPQNDTYVYDGSWASDTLTLYRTDTTGASIDSFKVRVPDTDTDTTIPDTYVDSAYVIETGLIDSIWIYRDSLGVTVDSFLTILNDSIDGYAPDTYVDSAYVIETGLIDTIWFVRDSSSVLVDSFFVVLNDSIQVDINYKDTFSDSARIGENGLNDTLYIYRVDTLGSIIDSFYTILNDSINIASSVIAFNGLSNQAADSIKLGGVLVENTTISGDQGTYDLIIDTLHDFRLNFDNTLIVKELDEGGTSEAQLILGALNAATSLKNFTSNNAGRFSIQSISTRWQWGDTTDFSSKSEIYMNNDGLHINPEDQVGASTVAAGHILQAQDANGRAQWKPASEIDGIADYDWVQIQGDSTEGYPIADYLPVDTADVDSLLWRRGEIRIGDADQVEPFGGVGSGSQLLQDHSFRGTGVQIYGDRTGIDHYWRNSVITGPYWWMRNDWYGDVFLRINGSSGEGVSTPKFEIGWNSLYLTDDATPDTTIRSIFQIDADADASALWIENNYLRSLNYPNTRTDDSIVVDSVFSLFTTDNAGRLMLVSLDTINAALNVAASAPQEIDTFAIVNDSLLLDLENTVGVIKRVDLSPYVNDSLIVSNDTLTLGDDIAVLPGGSDSLGRNVTAGEVVYGNGTAYAASESIFKYTPSYGRLTIGHDILMGGAASTGATILYAGYNRTGDGASGINMYANAGTALEARVLRNAGTNGTYQMYNTGTGDMQFFQVGAGDISFYNNNTESARINQSDKSWTWAGYGSGTFNTASPAYWLGVDASGNILERTDANLLSDIGGMNSFNISCFGCVGGPGITDITDGETLTFSEGSGMTLTISGNQVSFAANDNSATNEFQDLDVVVDAADEYRIDLSDAGAADDVTLVAGTNITLSQPSDNHIQIDASGGAADGDGIYDGSGTAPDGTIVTLGGTLDFNAQSGDVFKVENGTGNDYLNITPGGSTSLFSDGSMTLNSSAALTLSAGTSSDNINITASDGLLSATGHTGIDFTTGLGTGEDVTFAGDDIYLQADVLTDIQSNTTIGANTSDQLEVNTTTSTVTIGHEAINTTSYVQFQEDGDIAITASATNDNISLNPNVRTYFTGDYLYTNTGTDVRIGTSSEQSGNILNVSGSAYKSDGSTTWNTTSDRRTKKNIKAIQDPYEKIMKLKPVSFEYRDSWIKKNNLYNKKTHRGYIAQDYLEVFPEDVTEGSDGMLNMNHESAGIYTTAAVQQLIKDKEQLEATVAAQKNQIDQLQRMFFNLQQQVKELQDEKN